MLRLRSDPFDIEVKFDHKILTPCEIEMLSGVSVDGDRRCSLVTVDIDGNEVSAGISICHLDDNFCKAFGRQKALTYALDCLSKIVRTDIWMKYNSEIGFV